MHDRLHSLHSGKNSTLDASPKLDRTVSTSPITDALPQSTTTASPLFSETERANSEQLLAGTPSTPNQDLVYWGGNVIWNLQYANLYIGGSQSWSSSDIQAIDYSLNAAMSDRTLNNILSQYYGGYQPTSQFLGSAYLSDSAPSYVTKDGLESYISNLDQTGYFKNNNLSSTVFNFLLPSGTVLYDSDGRSSLKGLGGYHSSVHVNVNGKTDTIYYSVEAYSQKDSNNVTNGVVGFNQSWKNVAATAYHEMAEVRTDPDIGDTQKTGNSKYLGWMSLSGNECGDLPLIETLNVLQEVPLANGKGTVPIQLLYSNREHGSEVPYATQAVASGTTLSTIRSAALANSAQTSASADDIIFGGAGAAAYGAGNEQSTLCADGTVKFTPKVIGMGSDLSSLDGENFDLGDSTLNGTEYLKNYSDISTQTLSLGANSYDNPLGANSYNDPLGANKYNSLADTHIFTGGLEHYLL